jgi:hypothetical protein
MGVSSSKAKYNTMSDSVKYCKGKLKSKYLTGEKILNLNYYKKFEEFYSKNIPFALWVSKLIIIASFILTL